jgi:NAD-dependent deacetylase
VIQINWKEQVKELLEQISFTNETQIVAIVGSGASVASGLKTFRGKDGLYEGKRAEELASPRGFSNNPILVWNWYKERIVKTLDAKPNPIHHSLVELEKQGLLSCVITQNVDGLHRRAGQKNVIEIHGSILKTHCFDNCGITSTITEPPRDVPVNCECGNLQRPSVVWFGESLDYNNLNEVEQYLTSASIVLIIGTSGYVYPVAQFPVIAKQQGGAKLIEFNTDESAFLAVDDIFIKGPAEVTIPEFVNIVLELKSS